MFSAHFREENCNAHIKTSTECCQSQEAHFQMPEVICTNCLKQILQDSSYSREFRNITKCYFGSNSSPTYVYRFRQTLGTTTT